VSDAGEPVVSFSAAEADVVAADSCRIIVSVSEVGFDIDSDGGDRIVASTETCVSGEATDEGHPVVAITADDIDKARLHRAAGSIDGDLQVVTPLIHCDVTTAALVRADVEHTVFNPVGFDGDRIGAATQFSACVILGDDGNRVGTAAQEVGLDSSSTVGVRY
jgi:hypothetical protein